MSAALAAVFFAAACGLSRPLRQPAPQLLRDRTPSWSNPEGSTLTQVAPSVWLAERPFYPRLPGLQGVDVGCKMVVVRLCSGKLWVHSPVALDDALRKALAELGDVAHIVTPNTEHMKWAAPWIVEFPAAVSYAPPRLKERWPEVGWQRSLAELLDRPDGITSRAPPAEWEGELELCFVEDRVPLTRDTPFFNEVVFCHNPSRTLIVTDLYWNYPSQVPTPTRLWKFGMDVVYKPVYNRMMRTASWERSFDVIMNWDFEYIAPSHGEPVAQDAKRVLRMHLGYS